MCISPAIAERRYGKKDPFIRKNKNYKIHKNNLNKKE